MTLPLPDDRDYTFYLSASHIEKSDPFGEWEHGYKATLHALLVNKRGVRFVQPIEGCFDGIQPAFSAACPALVYLGNFFGWSQRILLFFLCQRGQSSSRVISILTYFFY
ncbi:uncharacterized protein LOC130960398 isoform X3 [Arachis stenosperma]|uniref:uncharacterized protein LOC130960398 isoform X3 n=1 Tax=Arachis stenosperma TaxID=217475 RepID=UPI0025AD0D73|nr:uncharacterized protein LOC130960398 isoform X3 [Arachis stenosperma]